MNICKPGKEILATVLTVVLPCLNATEGGKEGFYDRKSEGWFWYKEEPEPKKPVIKKLVNKQAKLPASENTGPEHFSAAWFRENLPRYKDAWWDNPTIENARVFAYMQRFVMDRSEQAQKSYELAVLGDPFLDEVSRRPYATFASQQVDKAAGEEREKLLEKIAQRVGIFFFFERNCEMCEIQVPIVKMLEQQYGFTVIPISADGSPLHTNTFPNYKTDRGHARQLGVVTYPALFLISPDRSFAPVGQGVMSLPDAVNRILIASRQNGWISDVEFNRSKPLMNTGNRIDGILQDYIKKSPADIPTTDRKGNYIPPEQLTKIVRKALPEKN